MPKNPNILLVTVDQWAGKALACAGHPVIETPTLDRLAHVGIRYTRAYSECPSCIPARRSLMTGSTARAHGDRVFQPSLRMPDFPTIANCFQSAGYQTTAIGKLHVYPKRHRIGFDEVKLAEEGRGQLGGDDDYDAFLAENNHPGAQFLHGMSNNEYTWRTWHLKESLHVTNWITTTAAQTIKRRDPTCSQFWHISYTHPHPPLVPVETYFNRYARLEIPPALQSDWSTSPDIPAALQAIRQQYDQLRPEQLADAKRAVYALSTHIDHQLRIIIGTLREEGLLQNTVILFCADHGDMLGDFGLFGKRMMYESSANIPMILVDRAVTGRQTADFVDDRLIGLQDVMPTLLELAGIDIPPHCDGQSAISKSRRQYFYGEASLGAKAVRMITDERFKLIWYPNGNHFQLFDLRADPCELVDISTSEEHRPTRERLTDQLVGRLYGEDGRWLHDGRLIGEPSSVMNIRRTLGLSGQRGLHYPSIPMADPSKAVGAGAD